VSDGPPAETAYVAVGSSIDPEVNVRAALELLRRRVDVTGVSTFYRTAALSASGEPDAEAPEFLNGVFEVRTDVGPRRLKLEVLRPIEDRLGRVRTADRYAPRPIDLDVVLCGERVVDEPGLKLPAADVRRPFVAWPLLELAPDLVLPDTGEALSCLWRGGPGGGLRPDPDLTRELREALSR